MFSREIYEDTLRRDCPNSPYRRSPQLTGLPGTRSVRIESSLIRCFYLSQTGNLAGGRSASYFTRVLRIAYLAPDIIEAIIARRQPPELTANKLVRVKNLPIDWAGQREALGFPVT